METLQKTEPLQVEALAREEASCRTRLAFEPADVATRKKLAWCLFLQAVHHTGRELLQPLTATEIRIEERPGSGGTMLRDANELLRECLRQSATVRQLSADPSDLTEVERLQSLIRLSGGDVAVSESELEARLILVRLASELLEADAVPQRLRRRARRSSS